MNCQRGDLAVVVFSIHEENKGAWVRVLRAGREPGEWIVRLMSPARGKVVGGNSVEVREAGRLAYCDDCNLRPIRGQRTPDPVHSLISEEAGA